jgi:diguanylate cyclase (GGDEF)-like protein
MARIELLEKQREHLAVCLLRFNNGVLTWLSNVMQGEFRLNPASLSELQEKCNRALQRVQQNRQVEDDLLPLLKRCILEYRRSRVRELEILIEKATDLEILASLDREMSLTEMFQDIEWFRETAPVRTPRLTDWMTLKRAEEIIASGVYGGKGRAFLPAKTFDDKFGVLAPSSSVAPELEYRRNQCDLREVGLALAYFDIDNFKTQFNIHTETLVDRNCLPVIMRAIEAQVFYHGSAYHEGGDEFIILLPNVEKKDAIQFMDRLRQKLPTLTFVTIRAQARISIGICHVLPDSQLTDHEVRLKANEAKRHARTKGGKDCIVTYGADKYTEDELIVVKPDERSSGATTQCTKGN